MSDIFTKFASHIKGATTLTAVERTQLADAISAAAPHMGINDLKALNKSLNDFIAADAAKHSKKAVRLQKLQAALENQADDPLIDSRVRLVRGALRRLGLGDLNDHSKNGIDPFELDRRCKEAGWQSTQTINLKIQCASIGLMD
jgi:hypothetical protein